MTLYAKSRIADSFTRAAATYDKFACVQKKTAEHLAAMLPADRRVHSILEAGSGTGYYSALLAQAYPHALILSLDVAFGMAKAASARLKDSRNVHFITADAENLPLSAGGGFDLITSNGAIQWFSSMENSLLHLKKHLRSRGVFLACFFGNRTLAELAAAIRSEIRPDAKIAAEFFPDTGKVHEIFRSVFPEVEFVERTVSRTYSSVPAMLHALKRTGVAPAGKSPLIRTRGDIQKIENCYLRDTGRVTASYHVIIVRAYVNT